MSLQLTMRPKKTKAQNVLFCMESIFWFPVTQELLQSLLPRETEQSRCAKISALCGF